MTHRKNFYPLFKENGRLDFERPPKTESSTRGGPRMKKEKHVQPSLESGRGRPEKLVKGDVKSG